MPETGREMLLLVTHDGDEDNGTCGYCYEAQPGPLLCAYIVVAEGLVNRATGVVIDLQIRTSREGCEEMVASYLRSRGLRRVEMTRLVHRM